jgi:hypothetical protein
MLNFLGCLFAIMSPAGASMPTADQILAAVAITGAGRQDVPYSGVRHYKLHNARFGKTAVVKVRMSSLPGQGAQFTVVERSGASRLTSIVERLLDTEAESSRPGKSHETGINPANYSARLRGSETMAGRDCFVLELTPKAKSKYLVNGTAWVDKETYGVVRLTGTTAASVSMWVGTPQILEEFSRIDGVWLPTHLISTSTSMLLGESGLEIHFLDYEVAGALPDRPRVASIAAPGGKSLSRRD